MQNLYDASSKMSEAKISWALKFTPDIAAPITMVAPERAASESLAYLLPDLNPKLNKVWKQLRFHQKLYSSKTLM